MNEEQVLKLAKETFASRHAVNGWFRDALPNFTAFANACCDYQRESDAKLFDGLTFGVYSHPSPIIRANTGEEEKMNCTWQQDEDGTWDTSCGKRFDVNDGTPEENNMKFCCYCGKGLVSHNFEQG